MAKQVTVYTMVYCPHCMRAKNLLKRKNIPFSEIDITEDTAKREEAEKRYGWMTVPMVVIGDQFIGGDDELVELERKGELDRLLK